MKKSGFSERKHGLPKRALALLLLLHPPSLFAQGSLIPPGPPAPVMKTLDQVEPRTPVDAVHTPGDFSDQFIISQPGSYYLTTNLVNTGASYGIYIVTNNVTLDLNGFSVLGTTNSYTGIYVPNNVACYNVVVRNGTVSGWSALGSYGIESFARNATFEHLTVCSNRTGLYFHNNTLVQDCVVCSNINNGIYVVGTGCLVLNNICAGNNSANAANTAGIYVGNANNRIEGNHVIGTGPAGGGIIIQPATSITNNIVIRNSVIGGGANNFSFNVQQIVGPLITNTVSSFITNANPWANFSF